MRSQSSSDLTGPSGTKVPGCHTDAERPACFSTNRESFVRRMALAGAPSQCS